MKDVLDQEISATTQLIETLVAERKSVLGGDAAALEIAVCDKQQTLEQLFCLEQQRMSIMESAGYNPSPDGMVFYLQQDQNKGEITDLWQQLLMLAADCRDQNRENHQLVEMYSHHTHQALCILRGEDPDQEVYGPGGNTRDHHERRSLAKA
jgi:flagellar biosynthesis/type III secretory pathway chaperone